MHEYYTDPFRILSDTFSIFRYIQYFQIYSVFLQSVLLQSVHYNQRFQIHSVPSGHKKNLKRRTCILTPSTHARWVSAACASIFLCRCKSTEGLTSTQQYESPV